MPLKSTLQMQATEPLRLEIGRLVELGRLEEALGKLDEATKRSTGSGLHLLKVLPDDQLVALLGGESGLDAGKALLLAELLNLAAQVHEREQAGSGAGLYSKALRLYLEAFAADPELPEHYAPRLEGLEAKLSDYTLPAELERQRFAYYTRQGVYAKAEDSLFELLERGEAELSSAEAFYRELERHSDAELRAGGLPREEVEEGLANVARLRQKA